MRVFWITLYVHSKGRYFVLSRPKERKSILRLPNWLGHLCFSYECSCAIFPQNLSPKAFLIIVWYQRKNCGNFLSETHNIIFEKLQFAMGNLATSKFGYVLSWRERRFIIRLLIQIEDADAVGVNQEPFEIGRLCRKDRCKIEYMNDFKKDMRRGLKSLVS